jgi:hypothetical protein
LQNNKREKFVEVLVAAAPKFAKLKMYHSPLALHRFTLPHASHKQKPCYSQQG